MSIILDSGAAETAAQIGRECVADRRSTRPLLVIFHQGSAFGRPRLSHGTVVCFPLAFIASRVVYRSLVSSMVEQYCLVTGAQHDVSLRTPRSYGQRSCQSGTLGHGMRTFQTLGQKPTPLGELDANALQWIAMVTTNSRTLCKRTHLQKLITSPCWQGID